MNIPAVDALSHLKVKSTSTRKVIKEGERLVQRVNYPKTSKLVHVYEYDNSNFFQRVRKVYKG